MKKENRLQSAVVFVRCALYARALSAASQERRTGSISVQIKRIHTSYIYTHNTLLSK